MNIEIIEVISSSGELVEHVIIDRGNGEFTSMPKEIYDKMIANANNNTAV